MLFSRALSLLGLGLLWSGWRQSQRVEVRRFDAFLSDLPPQADGMRVLQISDLHAGLWMPRAFVRQILRLARAQNADLVVFTGDVVTRRNSYLPPLRPFARRVTDYARDLAADLTSWHPPLGMWIAPGNHDLWEGDFGPISEILDTAGVRTLNNANIRFPNGLALVGLDDLRAGNPDYRAALAGLEADEPTLVLSHNPRTALMLRERPALILSGHTHGGQIRVPRGWEHWQPSPSDARDCAWRWGHFRVGRAQLYVSSGAGTIGVPLRFGVPPEIVIWTLRRGA